LYPALAAFIGFLTSLAIQPTCFDLQTQDRPDRGSPRAAVCAPFDNDAHWVLVPLVAVLLAVILARLLVRVRHGEWWALGVLTTLAVGLVATIGSLDYVVPV
jgi:hypothetical protein